MKLDFSWIRSAREYEKLYWIAKSDRIIKNDEDINLVMDEK